MIGSFPALRFGKSDISEKTLKRTQVLKEDVLEYARRPLRQEPGTRYEYNNNGINTGGRIIEVVSGMTFDVFVEKRISEPLGMKDTTFYPTDAQRARLATAYAKNKDTGVLEAVPPRPRSRDVAT